LRLGAFAETNSEISEIQSLWPPQFNYSKRFKTTDFDFALETSYLNDD